MRPNNATESCCIITEKGIQYRADVVSLSAIIIPSHYCISMLYGLHDYNSIAVYNIARYFSTPLPIYRYVFCMCCENKRSK